MSFLGKLASIFGMGDADEVLDDSPEAGIQQIPQPQPRQPQVDAAVSAEIDQEKTHAIFEGVVTVFNKSLPDFLAKSVDPEKEKKNLYDALDQSMRAYLDSLREAADLSARQSWAAEHQRLLDEANALKKKASDLESARSDMRDKQLSADRQKRALAERVHDLEDQVMKLEAEKEQYEIENKCMLNKAKANSVLEAEIEDLRAQLKEGGSADFTMQSVQIDNKALDEANARVQELEKANAELQEKVDSLSTGAKVKDEMGDAMLNDLQRKASEAQSTIESMQTQLQEAQEKVDLANARLHDAQKQADEKDAVCEMLKNESAEKDAKIQELNTEIEDLNSRLEDDEATQAEIAEIQKQMELFQQVKEKMDSRIEKLKASLQAAQEENKGLRETITANLLDHSKVQKELNEQIQALKEAAEPKDSPIEIDLTAEQSAHPLADADWLFSAPAADSTMRTENSESFGYQPPQKKARIENESHPSLFDL